jgi:hypothetical protein
LKTLKTKAIFVLKLRLKIKSKPMKHLFIGLSMVLATTAIAQNEVKVSEETQSYAKGSYNSVVVTVPYGVKELVIKALKDELKGWDGKVEGKGEYVMTQGKLKEMGEKLFDAYAKVILEGNGTVRVAIAIDLGGSFMTSKEHNAQYGAIVKKMTEFAKKAGAAGMDEKIKVEKKAFEKLEKQEKALIKEKEGHEKSIAKAKKSIEDNERKISENKEKAAGKMKEISAQREKVAELEKLQKSIR